MIPCPHFFRQSAIPTTPKSRSERRQRSVSPDLLHFVDVARRALVFVRMDCSSTTRTDHCRNDLWPHRDSQKGPVVGRIQVHVFFPSPRTSSNPSRTDARAGHGSGGGGRRGRADFTKDFDSVPAKFRDYEQFGDMERGGSRYASATTRSGRTVAHQNGQRQRRQTPNTTCGRTGVLHPYSTGPLGSSAIIVHAAPHTFFRQEIRGVHGWRPPRDASDKTRFDKRK